MKLLSIPIVRVSNISPASEFLKIGLTYSRSLCTILVYLFSVEHDATGERSKADVEMETDADLMRALDRLIIYLRIVYSIDFYAAMHYSLEDLMPHQCGIFHVRDKLDGGQNHHSMYQYEITDYIHVSHFYEPCKDIEIQIFSSSLFQS